MRQVLKRLNNIAAKNELFADFMSSEELKDKSFETKYGVSKSGIAPYIARYLLTDNRDEKETPVSLESFKAPAPEEYKVRTINLSDDTWDAFRAKAQILSQRYASEKRFCYDAIIQAGIDALGGKIN